MSVSTLDDEVDGDFGTITNDTILESTTQWLEIQRLKPRKHSAQTEIYFNPCSNSIYLSLVELNRVLRSPNNMTLIDKLAPDATKQVG